MLDPLWRDRALAGLREPFDLAIIGGGITGCGVLLDAAQRGLRCILLEKGDVASGTSSRSSKLIHGGLRYLKRMQLRITRLACRERDRMIALDPHLVEPIPFLYPAYDDDRTPGWQVDVGLWIYDRLTTAAHRHEHLEGDELASVAPELVQEGLDRAMVYTDARADDARLTLAVASRGADYGGLLLTRAEVLAGRRDAAGRLRGLVARDLETGRSLQVEARVIVNATGHWTDVVRERFGLAGDRVRPSRGTHLVLAPGRLRITTALAVASPDDGRPVFVIPHPEGTIVGTTDLFHEGSLDDPRPAGEEVEYLLRVLASAFPAAGIERRDVRGAWAGLRPILASDVEDPSAASREEAVWEEEGLVTVAGGKLTTYRVTAEAVVDEVVRRLPEERREAVPASATAGTPLAGLAPPDLAPRLQKAAGLSAGVAAGLARRLGREAWSALDLARGDKELRPLLDGGDLCAAEVRAHVRYGAVVRLEDLLLRRARLGMWDPAAAREVAPALRRLVGRPLGWSRGRWDRELEGLDAALDGWSVPAGTDTP